MNEKRVERSARFFEICTNSEKFFVMINKEEGCRSLN